MGQGGMLYFAVDIKMGSRAWSPDHAETWGYYACKICDTTLPHSRGRRPRRPGRVYVTSHSRAIHGRAASPLAAAHWALRQIPL